MGVTVHSYRAWDPFKEEWFYHSDKLTAERIRNWGAENIAGTAEEVDEAQLDEQGR